MVTTVGLERDVLDMLNNLLELEYDATEAYTAAIERLDHAEARMRLQEFREDHYRHIRELTDLVSNLGATPASGPGFKRLVTKGKVMVADLLGDKAILAAMKTNEDDTVTAYERASACVGEHTGARPILTAALADERRHRAWMLDAIERL